MTVKDPVNCVANLVEITTGGMITGYHTKWDGIKMQIGYRIEWWNRFEGLVRLPQSAGKSHALSCIITHVSLVFRLDCFYALPMGLSPFKSLLPTSHWPPSPESSTPPPRWPRAAGDWEAHHIMISSKPHAILTWKCISPALSHCSSWGSSPQGLHNQFWTC